MSIRTWQQTLDEVDAMKTYLKLRSMVYQVDGKEQVAEFCGLPAESFYYYSYADWLNISLLLQNFRGRALRLWEEGHPVPGFDLCFRNGIIWKCLRDYEASVDGKRHNELDQIREFHDKWLKQNSSK